MNTSIANLIANKLTNGLPHPGNKEAGEEPVTIRLPLFKMASMPAEMYQQVEHTVKMLSEAIVYVIETEGDSEIVKKSELQALRDELAHLKGSK